MKVEAIKKNQHNQVPELDELKIKKDRLILHFDDERYLQEENATQNIKPEAQSGSLQACFNRILGDSAKKRATVSISEDQKIHMDTLWDKYGQ